MFSFSFLQKVSHSVRERHSSGTRRGSYNFDRNDSYSDREGNWNASSKSRSSTRGHNHSQAEKSNSRTDRLASRETRAERSWSSDRHKSAPSYQSHDPMWSNSSQNNSLNVAYGMYSLPAINSSGVPPNGPSIRPLVMLYPFDHDAREFGSLVPVGFRGINEQSQLNDASRAWAFEECGFNRGSELRSSPDRQSSPYLLR